MGKRIPDSRLVHIFRENERVIERLGWKNYDSEEFAEGLFKLVKSLAEIDDRYNKKDLRVAVDTTKLSITPSEADLLCRKINDTMSYIKRKLRDSGSGARLPVPCKKIGKIWNKNKKEGKAKAKAKAKADKAAGNADGKADDKAGAKNIRETLGLPPKKALLCLKVSDSESEDEEEEGNEEDLARPSASAPSSSSALPSSGSKVFPKNPHLHPDQEREGDCSAQ